ncbi:hypothetical protein AJ80_09706 [Polytolypa hystricis UAMH7299]|uniref:Uncharacterized protein n=1 Tax=Polytolypa hystricis (strain UAMH7299) TaxID=1447883 RepID=A0A2B7WKY7_POLH7|nr:hypothetical protein AJ80_09706 [Polytolypa hystricis UAMH7299]
MREAVYATFADFSAPPSMVSNIDDIDWEELVSFGSFTPDKDMPPLDKSDFSNDSMDEKSHAPDSCLSKADNIQVCQSEPIYPSSNNCEGNVAMEENNEYIVMPLSQVTIFQVSTQYDKKEDGNKTYSIEGMKLHEAWNHAVIGRREESQSQSLETLEAPISLNDKPANSFVAIPSSLQTAVKKTPGGYEVNAEMTVDDMEEYRGLELVRAF